MADQREALQRLRSLFVARFHTSGAALPLAVKDPFPALTFALHTLWGELRRFVSLGDDGVPSLVPQSSNQTPLEVLNLLLPLLVSETFPGYLYFWQRLTDFHS